MSLRSWRFSVRISENLPRVFSYFRVLNGGRNSWLFALTIMPVLLVKYTCRKNGKRFGITSSFLTSPTDESFIKINNGDVPFSDVRTKSFSYLAFMGITPLEPTPTGMWSNIAWASCSFTGCTSLSSKFVRSKRTPQLMSNPTPPRSVQKARELIKCADGEHLMNTHLKPVSLLTGSMY